jgi:hydrogenase 3 maturation protease
MDYVILCIGNRYGGDDGVGPYIANKLKNHENNNYYIIDSGIIPENYTSEIKKLKPKNLILIDAVEMNLKPGEIRIIKKEKIGLMHISTHNIPISLLIKYLEKYVKNIYFIGIQSKKMSGELSKEVKKSADLLINYLKERKIDMIKILE